MEEIKEGLSQRIKKYEENLKELRDEKEIIDNKIQRINKLLESCKVLYADETGKEIRNISKSNNQRFHDMTINEAAIEVLKDLNEAHAKDITKKLLDGGKVINFEKPFVVVGNSLRQDERFLKLGKNRFRLDPEKIKESAPLFQSDRK